MFPGKLFFRKGKTGISRIQSSSGDLRECYMLKEMNVPEL